jgi:hypothetical protein
MILINLIFSIFSLAQPSQLDTKWLKCEYSFYSMPPTTVSLELFADGTTADHVRVTMQGKSHLESFTMEEKTAEMFLRGWISKESPDNAIEMVVFKEKKSQGLSKLINHKMPFGKEMWGDCILSAHRANSSPLLGFSSQPLYLIL